MKKICFIKWTFDDSSGGDKVAVQLSNELSKNYEVHLLGMSGVKEKPFYAINANVNFKILFPGKQRISRLLFKAIKQIRKYVKTHNIDVIFTIGPVPNFFVKQATLFLKTKCIFCDHVSLMLKKDDLSYRIYRYFGTKLDKVVTLTEEDCLNYINKYHLKNTKVTQIYNWIDELKIETKYPVNAKKIVTVGRFVEEKGYDLLLRVADIVLKQYPDWHWDIYGSGTETKIATFDEQVNKLQLQNNVHRKGVIQDINAIYENHSIYVMTSYYEGLPLVLLEAQQFHLPIVSFASPTGPSEIVEDNKNGFLIDCYDVDEMAKKLMNLMEDANLRQNFADHSQINMAKFLKDKIIKQWITLIEEVS